MFNFAEKDLRLLKVFTAVVESGGYTAAQAEMNIGASTISNHMTELEQRLGAKLCQRGRVGFQPDKGEQLGHPLASRPRTHVTRERLGTDERRPRRSLVPARRHEHRKVAKAALPCPLDQRERLARIRGDERGGPPGQRRGDRSLVACVDLEQR